MEITSGPDFGHGIISGVLLTISEAAAQLRAGALKATDLVEQSLSAIARFQPSTNAFIRVDAEGARTAAARADRDFASGVDRGPLHGIPISIKDLVDIAGQPTTAASRVLAENIAKADAPLVARLRSAGAVLIGKTNLHEFALGTTSEASAFGAVHHPSDPRRSPGGSSGGSAAAVACGMGLASIGTDTGGSIRIPASVCGVVGLKPGFGEVPTAGVVPLSTSFDHAGPITRSAADAAALWSVLSGAPMPAAGAELKGLRLVRLVEYFDRPVEPGIRTAFEGTLRALRAAGCSITEAVLPNSAGILDAYVNIVLPEGAAWHARYLDSRASDYTPTVRARFESGRSIPAVKYVDGMEFCRRLRADVDALFERADAIVLPTMPITAPLLGSDEITIDPAVGDKTPMRSAMLKHTQPFNMSGHPAISLPMPMTGLPAGLQIVGRHGGTGRLLAIAAACEKIIGNA
ncbi:MAG TPA: amidase [Vicinamibacterales bacterium]|nr:amidase [Vicinamibacterales bacterium]